MVCSIWIETWQSLDFERRWYLPEVSPFPDILREMAKRTAEGEDPDYLYRKVSHISRRGPS